MVALIGQPVVAERGQWRAEGRGRLIQVTDRQRQVEDRLGGHARHGGAADVIRVQHQGRRGRPDAVADLGGAGFERVLEFRAHRQIRLTCDAPERLDLRTTAGA
jgi:hypothetical protein